MRHRTLNLVKRAGPLIWQPSDALSWRQTRTAAQIQKRCLQLQSRLCFPQEATAAQDDVGEDGQERDDETIGVQTQYEHRRGFFKKAPLGMPSLGQPAAALVLQENLVKPVHTTIAGSDESRRHTRTQLETDDLVENVYSEDKPLRLEEAFKNIERLREDFLQIHEVQDATISAKVYGQLFDSLSSGFTKEQLVQYLVMSPDTTNNDPFFIHRPFECPKYSRSRWQHHPQVETLTTQMQRQLQPVAKQQLPLKILRMWRITRLSHHIIMSRWGIYQRDPEGTIGAMVIRLHPDTLELIIQHKSNPLQHIRDSFTAVIETPPKTHLLVLRATFEVAKEVLRALIDVFDRIDSTIVTPTSLPEKYVRRVARLTSTVITKHESKQLQIFFLGPSHLDIEDATRLLQYHPDLPAPGTKRSRKVAIHKPKSVPIFATPLVVNNLPLAMQHLQWSRLACATPRIMTSKSTDIGRDEKKQVLDFLDELQSFRCLKATSDRHWNAKPQVTTHASFGHLAISWKSAADIELRLKRHQLPSSLERKIEKSDITFLQDVPWVRNALTFFRRSQPLKGASSPPRDTFLITLMPKSYQTPQIETPKLELLVGSSELIAARFVVEDNQMHLLLPQRPLDISFRRCTSIDSTPGSPDVRLLDYLESSNLNPQGAERLRCPPELEIHVPPQAFPEDAAGISSEGVLARYVLGQIAHQSATGLTPVATDHSLASSFTLTAIEAGQGGGRREELSILAQDNTERSNEEKRPKGSKSGSPPSTSKAPLRERARETLQAAVNIVEYLELRQQES